MTTRTRRYAEDTRTPAANSQSEIRNLLMRVGADQYMFGGDDKQITIGFRAGGRYVNLSMPLPDDKPQTERAVWRRVVLLVKARVTEIQEEMLTLDEAFMPFMMLPDGGTLGRWLEPQIEEIYSHGAMPRALPGLSAPALGEGR